MFFRATPVDKDAAIAAYFSGLRPEPRFLRGKPLRTPNKAAAIADLEALHLYFTAYHQNRAVVLPRVGRGNDAHAQG